jgi:hypothetical protein
VLVNRFSHLEHVQFFAAKDWLQLFVSQDFSFVLWILKVVFLNVRPNFLVISVRGSASVPTILARCSEGCTGFINALFEALGDVFAIFDLHSYLRFEIRDHRIVMDQAADVRTQKFRSNSTCRPGLGR